MTREVLHGPTDEDRRAVQAAAARRQAVGSPQPCWVEDEALGLAAVDLRNGLVVRGLASLAWAYNRSPLRVLLEATDLPLLIIEGVLPAFWRWLAFRLLTSDQANAYRLVARTGPLRHSGWRGCTVVLAVWIGLATLALCAL